MRFGYDEAVLTAFSALASGVLRVRLQALDETGLSGAVEFAERAPARLADGPESRLPEIRAWRAAFARMGLTPNRHRCAAGALLRRLRRDGTLPAIHPLVDVCNAASAAGATPVAVFDLAGVQVDLTVRHTTGTERHETFAGEIEHPVAGKVVVADTGGQAHSRRWTSRQGHRSAVTRRSTDLLIVAEALHRSAVADVAAPLAALERTLCRPGIDIPVSGLLSARRPHIDVPAGSE